MFQAVFKINIIKREKKIRKEEIKRCGYDN